MSQVKKKSNLTETRPLGVLNIDKPAGMTSHDVVDRVRKIYKLRKVGHTGTLDPEATGILPILVGGATRFSRFFQNLKKTYQVEATLGTWTDTQDSGGQILGVSNELPTEEKVIAGLHSFLGEQWQKPPMYSAVRIQGKRLYELAREGKEIERPERKIQVAKISDVAYNPPLLTFSVEVSAGTYIRTLCHDLGQLLGCGAMMSKLRRSGVGPFSLDGAVELESLAAATEQEKTDYLIPLADALSFFPALRVLPEHRIRVGRGQGLFPSHCELPKNLSKEQKIRILDCQGILLAMGQVQGSSDADSLFIAPIRVVAERISS